MLHHLTKSPLWYGLLGLLLTLQAHLAGAQTLTFDQARVVARAGLDEGFAFGRATAADDQGNVYVTGTFGGIQQFGNVTLQVTRPDFDMYVAKLDSLGQVQWAVRGGGASNDYSWGVAVDAQGSVYVTGSYVGPSATYGPTTLRNTGTGSLFVAKISAAGQWQWAVGSADGGVTTGNAIAVGPTGAVYVAATQHGGATALGGFALANQHESELVVAQLDANGTWRWAASGGGVYEDEGASLAVDEAGDAYVTGTSRGAGLTFGPVAASTTAMSSGYYRNVIVAKISATGVWQWATTGGSPTNDMGLGIAVDRQRVYVTGAFERDAYFGTTRLVGSGDNDIFVACLTRDGTWQWARQGGGPGGDAGSAVAADGEGYVYVAGSFWQRPDAPAYFNVAQLPGYGGVDALVARLDSAGGAHGVITAGGAEDDACAGLALRGRHLYAVGHFGSSGGRGNTARFGEATLVGNPTTFGQMYTAWVTRLPVPRRVTAGGSTGGGSTGGGSPGGSGSTALDDWDARANLPNTITPNADGANDTFAPRALPAGPWQLTVYSRWGQRLYHSADYRSSWGAEAPAGVHYYLLRHAPTGRSFKGWVEVVR